MASSSAKFVPLGELQEDEDEIQSISNEEKVISLINEAQLVDKEKKIECLSKVRELIINTEPSLLDNFFEEVMAFQQDSSVDVRKFVVNFIEDACKKDNHLLSRAIPMLQYILKDKSNIIQKRVIVCFMQLYKIALLFILKSKSLPDTGIVEMWQALENTKQDICSQLDTDSDGIRTLVIKFIETVILTQTRKENSSEPPKSNELDVSIDMIPISHNVLKATELREQAGTMLTKILELTTSLEVSSVTLMTCISTLGTVARQRPVHMSTVIQTFEILHGNLPPHFSSSQINSVAKHLKSQVLSLSRHPSSYEFHPQLITLLTALGSSQSEINKNMSKRPAKHDNEGTPPFKKSKMGVASGNNDEIKGNAFLEAVDITTNELKSLLVPESVVELVISNMHKLPDIIPVAFRHSFTPIAAAGTDAQLTQIARLLASHMTSAGLGAGATARGIQGNQKEDSPLTTEGVKKEEINNEGEMDLQYSMDQLHYLGSLLGLPSISDPHFPTAYAKFFGSCPSTTESEEMETDRSNLVPIQTSVVVSGDNSSQDKSLLTPTVPQKLKKIKQFDLSSIVKPLSRGDEQLLGIAAFQRILDTDGALGPNQTRNNLIIQLVLQFGGEYNTALYKFIFDNFKTRFDLALSWLYGLYCVNHRYYFTQSGPSSYDDCLITLMKGAHKKLDARDRLFTRLLLEAPLVTANALTIVKSYCRDEDRVFVGICTLRDLIMKKPQGVNEFLDVLLEVAMNDLELARIQALHIVKKFYSRSDLSDRIERYAVQTLQYLLADHPTFQQISSDIEVTTEWSEEGVKICMGPLLTLLPVNSQLLKELAIVYTNTSATVKRILLKLLDQPVRAIGMHSPQLLELVESCPKGAETLIMRILYILTENAAPTSELVKRVRELYQRSNSDVRFLIPVLHGLTKQEILSALPKFIRLSPNVTKGVFERLLISYKGEGSQLMSPISPSELLIALHTVDCKGDELLTKAVVRATNLCFQEKTVYTQEVLAVVLQQLIEHTPIPFLFMRTVIQSLGVCPRLLNFVMTILTKMISKQIWKSPKLWQGFIKCCEVTMPHSFQVIIQLPPKQLEQLLQSSSQLRDPFINNVQALSVSQKAAIPRSVMMVIEIQRDINTATTATTATIGLKTAKRRKTTDQEIINE